jgi:hypothetical protein
MGGPCGPSDEQYARQVAQLRHRPEDHQAPRHGAALRRHLHVLPGYVRAAVEERGCPDFGSAEETSKATHYLAQVVWQSIGDVVIAARAAMSWLQTATRLASHNGIDELWWTTPAGFEARQSYKEMDYKRLDTTFLGSRIRLM